MRSQMQAPIVVQLAALLVELLVSKQAVGTSERLATSSVCGRGVGVSALVRSVGLHVVLSTVFTSLR